MMDTMGDGLSFRLTSDEVIAKLDELVIYRKSRLELVEREIKRATTRPVEDYQQKIDESLEERHGPEPFGDSADGRPQPNASTFKDTVVHELRTIAESHRRTISRLEFMRDHVVKNLTFRLKWMELAHLFPDSRDHGAFPACFGHPHDEFEEDGLDYFGPPPAVSPHGRSRS